MNWSVWCWQVDYPFATAMAYREFGSILDQRGLELVKGRVLSSQSDDELRQIFVVDSQVVLQLCADFGDQRELLQLLQVVHRHRFHDVSLVPRLTSYKRW